MNFFFNLIAQNSSLSETIVDNDLRCIDWKRGNPYIYSEKKIINLFVTVGNSLQESFRVI